MMRRRTSSGGRVSDRAFSFFKWDAVMRDYKTGHERGWARGMSVDQILAYWKLHRAEIQERAARELGHKLPECQPRDK